MIIEAGVAGPGRAILPAPGPGSLTPARRRRTMHDTPWMEHMETVYLSAVASALHLLALGIGLGAGVARARALRAIPGDPSALPRVLEADNWYGIAALLWLGSGLWRLLGPVAKGTNFYLHNALFHAKMGTYALIFLLELWPMITFIRWRVQLAKGLQPDLRPAATFARLTQIEVALVLVMLGLATLMARGVGQFT